MTQVPTLIEPRGMVIADTAYLRTTTCIITGGVVLSELALQYASRNKHLA